VDIRLSLRRPHHPQFIPHLLHLVATRFFVGAFPLQYVQVLLEAAMKSRMMGAALYLALAVMAGQVAPAMAETKSNSNWSWSGTWGSHTNWGKNVTKGSDVVKTETRAVQNFSRVEVHVPADVMLVQGTTESLTITTDDNLLPLIQTRVDGNTLKIEGDRNRGFSTRKGLKIQVALKNLEAIAIEGSGDVEADTLRVGNLDASIRGSGDMKFKTLRGDNIKVRIDGSGDVAVDAMIAKSVEGAIRGSGDMKFSSLKTESVKVSIDGSGDFSAAGITETVDARIAGSGDIRMRSLLAREVTVSISASGDAEVNATEKLKATVNGSGGIRYVGAPKNLTKSVQGSGSVTAF
jgi:hypothetical protein